MIKDKYRIWCIENGISHMDDKRWREYKQERIDQLNKMVTQMFVEEYTESVLDMEEFDTSCDFTKKMEKYFDHSIEDIRLVAKEVEIEVNTKKNNLNTLIDLKAEKIKEGEIKEDVVNLVLSAGKQMVEINELQNRELIRRQMTKVEETLYTAYSDVTYCFVTLLNKKLKK